MTEISAEFPFEKKSATIRGSTMSYVDEGQGDPVLFLHGNPTSSYLWRNIIPYVTGTNRAIAPDLIGMGDSDKPDIDYRLPTHAEYLDEFISGLGLKHITLVVHDWGSALGMRYARLNPDKVRAIAVMEPIMPPALPAESYEAMGDRAGPMFRNLQTPGVGEEMIYEANFFVETVLGNMGVAREMTEAEMEVYRAPYLEREARKPTLIWPRQMPVAGKPSDVAEIITANGEWFYSSPIPKLFFFADPGALMPSAAKPAIVARASNLTTVDLDAGTHYLQEDHPHTIGENLATWIKSLPAQP